MHDTSTATLLAAAASGDQASWDELVRRHTNLLWSVARSFRLGAADAGDAVQMGWLRLVENLDRITAPDRLDSWLATTVRRECLRILRRTGRESPIAGDDAALDVPDTTELDTKLLADERDAELWTAFAGMSQPCQRLLRVLMATPPPSYAAVAAALDMPIGSIGPTRARCLKRLRSLLQTTGGLVEAGDVPPAEGSDHASQ